MRGEVSVKTTKWDDRNSQLGHYMYFEQWGISTIKLTFQLGFKFSQNLF